MTLNNDFSMTFNDFGSNDLRLFNEIQRHFYDFLRICRIIDFDII